ncbi:hypothetical protein MF406_14835 [Georgenia sp. TF02-10]|uniref:hypothetical protein n=1 Tax=Georgenia sp. TF02-10 TaxID=2917725 RepID=UPI001FA7F036|nr:hypothetical protein [Georgenia sp. TF02-10]UNX54192.1 hypothetical protein MF406_14835 [Georgenia sp. TF02-10]
MTAVNRRVVPAGIIRDAWREHRWLPEWWENVPQVALEAALRLADGDPRRLRLDDDGSVQVVNG